MGEGRKAEDKSMNERKKKSRRQEYEWEKEEKARLAGWIEEGRKKGRKTEDTRNEWEKKGRKIEDKKRN